MGGNFMIEDLIEQIISSRTESSGSVRIWIEITEEKDGELVYEGELSIEEEIEMECREKGIEVSTERWEVFENPGITIYALSVAWIEDGELSQYCTTLESF
jgi:hypothetical protein